MPSHRKEPEKRPKLGYLLYFIAAVLWALNGTVAKVILERVGDPLRVSQFRGSATAAILVVFVLLTRPRGFRMRTFRELGTLAGYGIIGVACCQWFYFESISRIPIAISLLIEFIAPIFVVLFAHFVWKQPVRPTVWLGLTLATIGLSLVQQVWLGVTLNLLGIYYALLSMMCLVVMYLLADKASRTRDPVSLLMWAFIASASFFAVLRPWSEFPWESLQATVQPFDNRALTLPIAYLFGYMVVGGTLLPYVLVINSIRHIGGAGASIMGLTEPPVAAIIAWAVIGASEALNTVQMLGGLVILLGILMAENARESARRRLLVTTEVAEVV
jgi:drug/metabolite transporter (DMT)-like permease